MQEVARLLGLAIDYDSPTRRSTRWPRQHREHPAGICTHAAGSGLVSNYPDQLGSTRGHASVTSAVGATATGRAEKIVISTRSLLEVMFYLSQGSLGT